MRNLKDIDLDIFKHDIEHSTLVTDPPDDIVALVDCYNTTILGLMDKHAPSKTKTITFKPESPWFTEEIREARKRRRRAE